MKHVAGLGCAERKQVAPRAGAWIETLLQWPSTADAAVAPRAGAWIETLKDASSFPKLSVAPRAGAWIET